jgi:hypothetical protein
MRRLSIVLTLIVLAGSGLGGAALRASPLSDSREADKKVVDGIFGNWQVMQGGMGAFEFIKNYEIEETFEIQGQEASQAQVHIVRTRSDHLRIETSRAASGTIVEAFDGRIGWRAHPQWGLGLIRNAAADSWISQNDLLIAFRNLPWRNPRHLLPDEKVNGRDCIVVSVTDAEAIEQKWFFDRATRQVLRFERPVRADSTFVVAVEFGDYRKVDPLTIPFLVTLRVGSLAAVHHRSKVVINPAVDESSFILSTAQYEDAVAVEAILNRNEAAGPGAEALARIRTRVTHLSLESTTTGVKSSQTISQKAPNLILVESETPGMGWETRGFDGTSGWVSSELQGFRPLKPPELMMLMSSGSIHTVGKLADQCPFRRLVGERLVGGRPATVVALATQQGPAGSFYFDKENGRLVRIASPATGDRTNFTESTVEFSDFRTVDGVEIPFVAVQTNPMMRVVSTVQSVENNVPLKDEIFRPRRED